MSIPVTPGAAGHSTASSNQTQSGFSAALAFLVMLFFAWGFLTSINDILIPHFRDLFELSHLEAALVQFCFFGAYFIMGIPSGMLIDRVGNKRGIVIALGVMAFGCLMFLPAAKLVSYPLFLGALFVLASGIVVLQTAANPFVALLGSEETAARRLNLSQAFNSLGTTIGPVLAAYFILRDAEGLDKAALADAVRLPYVFLAIALGLLAVVFAIIKLPRPAETLTQHTNLSAHRPLILGVVAIFFYVGAEVSVGSFLVDYMNTERLGGLSKERVGYLVAFYWGGAMVGRFLGSAIMAYIRPNRLLMINALCAIGLLLITMTTSGTIALWSVLAIGLFNSVMFPNIFTLAIAGLGEGVNRASGWLVMAIVGGAILPLLQGLTVDKVSIAASFLVPIAGYAYVAFYGWKGWKPTTA